MPSREPTVLSQMSWLVEGERLARLGFLDARHSCSENSASMGFSAVRAFSSSTSGTPLVVRSRMVYGSCRAGTSEYRAAARPQSQPLLASLHHHDLWGCSPRLVWSFDSYLQVLGFRPPFDFVHEGWQASPSQPCRPNVPLFVLDLWCPSTITCGWAVCVAGLTWQLTDPPFRASICMACPYVFLSVFSKPCQ